MNISMTNVMKSIIHLQLEYHDLEITEFHHRLKQHYNAVSRQMIVNTMYINYHVELPRARVWGNVPKHAFI